jgi:outer membrane lipoprotein-sorting protein
MMPWLIVFVVTLTASGTAASAQTLTAREIMERASLSTKVLDSIHDAVFTLTNKSGQQRVRKVSGTTKLQKNGVDNMRLARFLAPPDVAGTVTLLLEYSDREDEMWIYLPALKKVRRLSASNKRDSFVGTDFSFGDVIGHRVDDWDHRLAREEAFDGEDCYVIESVPRRGEVKANSGYIRRRSWVQKVSFVTVRGEFWDETGQLLKAYEARDVVLVDPPRKRWHAMQQEMVNLQTGHRSQIRFETFKVNQNIKDELFTTRQMEREQ